MKNRQLLEERTGQHHKNNHQLVTNFKKYTQYQLHCTLHHVACNLRCNVNITNCRRHQIKIYSAHITKVLQWMIYRADYRNSIVMICLFVCFVLNITSTHVGHFVTGCSGGKAVHQAEDGKCQNNAHILVTRLPRTH